MKQAVYNLDNAWCWSALKRPCSLYSVIRRYPDLLLHRAIKYLIAKKAMWQRTLQGRQPVSYHYTFSMIWTSTASSVQ
ncbi:hypothetical protein O9929_01300 [Vibrio lentus]|nr:hypothetical protein [Vibrio lentus]